MAESLVLKEWGPSVVAKLDEAEASALRLSNAAIEINFTREPGTYSLRATNVVGCVVLPNKTIRIIPKVPVERLLFLLGFAPSLLQLKGTATATRSDDFVVAMKTIYAAALEQLFVGGIIREYVDAKDELVGVRGRIDVVDLHLRRFGLFPPMACAFQDYAFDNDANRRLLAAAELLAQAGDRRDASSATLKRFLPRFLGVERVRFDPTRVDDVRRTRLLRHYDPALAIAELVLKNASLEFPAGTGRTVAFTVNMDKVYESFVARSLRAALGLASGAWQEQATGFHIDEGAKFPVVFDVLWRAPDGKPLIVIDAKYKRVERARREDVHQVVAYCSALGIKDAVLIYPECAADLHVVAHSGIRIHQHQLGISGSIEEIGLNVATLKNALFEIATTKRDDRALTEGTP
jgi:5-methylcytosine-specific restriction enzyme subunit McrC